MGLAGAEVSSIARLSRMVQFQIGSSLVGQWGVSRLMDSGNTAWIGLDRGWLTDGRWIGAGELSHRLRLLQSSLTEQYSALNALLSQLQSTSSYLTQAFATLPNAPKGTASG